MTLLRNLATEAKHLSDTQAIDLDSIQQKLSAHDDQLREVKEHVKRNDEKHQRSYEKLLDSMGALSVAQEKILEMLQPDSAVKYRPSRNPAVQPSAPGASATFTRDRPTKVEHRCSAFIKGSRAPSPSPLRITSEDLNQTSIEEVPEAEKEDVSKNEVPVVATEQPIPSLRVETERVPEPNSVGTSTKRDKVDSVLNSVEPTACAAPAVPGAEVTQLIVDTMAKTLQKSLQAIVKPEQSRSKPSSYKDPTKDGSVDNWVVLMRSYLESRQAPMTPKDKAWMIVENLDGDARNYIMNKTESELSNPEQVFKCLTRRFGSGIGRAQTCLSFADRTQGEDEDMMTFLDALESLRAKGFPDEDVVTRRYEIMQKFIAGVRSVEVHSALATKYAEEKYVKDPPTEEELRYVAMEFVRLRKPRWEQQVFQPTQIPPPSPEVPAEPTPLLVDPQPAGPEPVNENRTTK